jgi:transglutaminase superfamily protein
LRFVMQRLRKLLGRPRRFKWLLVEAFVRLGAVTAIRFSPLPRGARSLMRAHRVSLQPRRTTPSSEEICRAVNITARFIPGATCLMKAQVACAMLNRFGYAAEIKIGVLKKSSDLAAHAWVEFNGLVVLGDTGNQYVEMPKIVPLTGELELPGT